MRKIALLAIGAVGLLVVFALLAFAYAPNMIVSASPAAVLDRPATTDTSAATDNIAVIIDTSDAEDAMQVSASRGGHFCNGDKAESASAGY